MLSPTLATLAIAVLTTAAVIARPCGWPESIWPALGVALLLVLRLLSLTEALAGIAKGADVYLFLIGMMLLSEIARGEGLFNWLAAHATRAARGSATGLFLLIYLVGWS